MRHIQYFRGCGTLETSNVLTVRMKTAWNLLTGAFRNGRKTAMPFGMLFHQARINEFPRHLDARFQRRNWICSITDEKQRMRRLNRFLLVCGMIIPSHRRINSLDFPPFTAKHNSHPHISPRGQTSHLFEPSLEIRKRLVQLVLLELG